MQNRELCLRAHLFFFAGLIDVRFGKVVFFWFCAVFGLSGLDIGPELLSAGAKWRRAKNGKRVQLMSTDNNNNNNNRP